MAFFIRMQCDLTPYPLLSSQNTLPLTERKVIVKNLLEQNSDWVANHPAKVGKTLSLISPEYINKKITKIFLRTIQATQFKDARDINSLLFESIVAGNQKMALKLFKILKDNPKLDVDVFLPDKQSLLCKAVDKNMEKLTYKLLHSSGQKGSEARTLALHFPDYPCQSFMELAYQLKFRKTIYQLLKYGAEVNPIGEPIWKEEDLVAGGLLHSLLIACIKRNKQKIALRIIKAMGTTCSFDLNAKNEKNLSLLHLCCKYDCTQVALKLIKKGANIQATDNLELTVADYADLFDDQQIREKIYEQGFFSELTESAWLAHIWNICGTKEFGEITFEYAGFDTILASKRIVESVQSFLESAAFKERLNQTPAIKKMNLDELHIALQTIYENYKRTPQKIVENIQKGTTQVVPSNWDLHLATVIFGRKHRVMKGNRGTKSKSPGIEILEMQNDKHLLKVVNGLKSEGRISRSMFRSEMDRCLQLVPQKTILQKHQVGGFCACKSNQSAVYASFYDQALETFPEDEQFALDCAVLMYKDWVFYARFEALENYLKISRKPDQELLDKIVAKSADLESRKPRWQGQNAVVIQIIRTYIADSSSTHPIFPLASQF
jgi:hypothetical protein